MNREAIEKRLLLRRAKAALELGTTPMTEEYFQRLQLRHHDAAPDDFDKLPETIPETMDAPAAASQRERTSLIQRGLFDAVESL